MATLTPIDGNPFEQAQRAPLQVTVRPSDAQPRLTPVEGNPFAGQGAAQPSTQPSTLENVRNTMSDVASGIGQGASFGFLDEAVAAGLTPIEMGIGLFNGSDQGMGLGERIGAGYDRALGKVRADVKQAQERSPIGAGAGEIVGGITSAGGLAKQGFSLLNAVKASYPQMIGRGAVEGAGYGALHGFGTGEGSGRVDQALREGGIGALTGGVAGAVGAKIANRAASASAPTAEELRRAANLAYTEAENANVIINPASFDRMVSNAFTKLANEGVDPTLHPGVMAALKRLEELRGQPVAFKTLDILRRVANSAGRNVANKDEARLAGHLVDELDDLMNKLGPRDVLTGDGAIAGEMIQAGRTLWARSRKTEAMENIIQRAEDKAGANYTGAGFQTALRQELKAVLRSPAALRGFSESEVNMIRSIVRGASVENFLRHIGKFAPRGLVGTTLSGGAGYAMGGPVGAAAMLAIGEGAKRTSSAITNAKMQNLIEAVRRGGPRVVRSLSDKNRALLENAIVGGELTLDQLGLSMPVTSRSQ